MALRIRDEKLRDQAVHRLENLPSERVTTSIYEFNVADCDDGLWDEEVNWFDELLEGTRDRIIVWRFAGTSFTRTTIGNDS